MKKHSNKQPNSAVPAQTNKMVGNYDGAELRRLPGITSERFDAFALPSRIGRTLYYPDGRTERL